MKAKFITIEGGEGSGKTSVINFLENLLKDRGLSVKVFREPGSTKIGEEIRKILLDNKNKELARHTELLLYLAARTQLIEEQLKTALLKYDFVVCDRFFDSTIVYQGVGLGLGKIVEQAVKIFSLGVNPDITLLLDTKPEIGLSRIQKKDRIESRSIKFHSSLRSGYLALAKKYPKRIKVVNAQGALESIYSQVKKIVQDKFKI